MVEVIVVGAGTSGLACAQALVKAGAEVLVLESKPRAGGDTRTLEVGEFLFETGPWAARADALPFRELVAELGLEGGLVHSNPAATRWYALKDGTLWPVPRSTGELLRSPLLSLRGRLRALVEPVVVGRDGNPSPAEETDLREFLERRLGVEAGELFAELFARSTHGAPAGTLGSASAFPELTRGAAGRLGVVRDLLAGEGPIGDEVVSFHGGLSALIESLTRSLGTSLSTSSPVAELQRGAGGWRVTLESGEALTAPQVVLAVPAAAAYPLLAMCAPQRLELDELRHVEHERITNVHLGLDGVSLLPGRGIVTVPAPDPRMDTETNSESAVHAEPGAGDRTPLLGAVFHSNLFPGRAPTGTVAVSCSYRATDDAPFDEEQLPRRAEQDLLHALSPTQADSPTRIVASHVRAVDVPRLSAGHGARMGQLVARLRRALPGLYLTGSYAGGLGIASRVSHARATAGTVAAEAAEVTEAIKGDPQGTQSWGQRNRDDGDGERR